MQQYEICTLGAKHKARVIPLEFQCRVEIGCRMAVLHLVIFFILFILVFVFARSCCISDDVVLKCKQVTRRGTGLCVYTVYKKFGLFCISTFFLVSVLTLATVKVLYLKLNMDC